MLCAKYCREILFCLCEAHSSMAFLCLSSSLEPDWIHKAAAGKFIGTVFCWELLWKVQVSDELLPAIPQKLLLVSEKTPEEFSLYLEYSYPSENQLAEYLPVFPALDVSACLRPSHKVLCSSGSCYCFY